MSLSLNNVPDTSDNPYDTMSTVYIGTISLVESSSNENCMYVYVSLLPMKTPSL